MIGVIGFILHVVLIIGAFLAALKGDVAMTIFLCFFAHRLYGMFAALRHLEEYDAETRRAP